MKSFLAFVIFLVLLLVSAAGARAQSGADEKYIAIYGLIQQGDNLVSTGEPQDALAAYLDARTQLLQLQKRFPDWNASIIAFRLNYLNEKIAELRPPSAVPAEPVVPAPATNESGPATAKLQDQMDNLQAQLQSEQTENRNLQAKLKEALAAQPAAVDANELVKAREQIRWLMKDNDLLKASRTNQPVQMVPPSTSRDLLVEYVRKYSAEHQRAEKLAAEMAALQQSFSKSAPADSATVATLRAANEKLKLQLVSFLAAATNAPVVEKLTAELADARSQIATLKATVRTVTQQNVALEKQVHELSDEMKASADDFAKRIRQLTQERDDLLAQLAAADKKISQTNSAADVAQIMALNDQVNALRARIAVDEAKAVPYTADELALFRQAAPTPAPVVTEKKPINEMPAGSAELVASAQRHFASREFDAAEADYQKILERNQNNGLVLANLATIELQQGKLADAEKHLQAALAQSPDDAYNLSTLGYLKFREEKYDDALEVLSRAVKIDPNNPEIENYLGVTLGHKGLRVQAETALRKAIQIDANYAPAHNNLAVIYLNQTPPLPQLARWHYQKALDAGQPRNPDLEKMLAEQGASVTP